MDELLKVEYRIKLTREELNDIWRAKLMLDNPDDWTPAAIHAVSTRLKRLVDKIKMADAS